LATRSILRCHRLERSFARRKRRRAQQHQRTERTLRPLTYSLSAFSIFRRRRRQQNMVRSPSIVDLNAVTSARHAYICLRCLPIRAVCRQANFDNCSRLPALDTYRRLTGCPAYAASVHLLGSIHSANETYVEPAPNIDHAWRG
jgi:hypothetical protein